MDYKNPKRHTHTAFWARLLPALALSLTTLGAAGNAVAKDVPSEACTDASIGSVLENVNIQDGSKQSAQIPSFGDKVLLILYTDPDVADQNDPFADAVKGQNLDRNFFQSIGIANMDDAPAKPNWIIRAIIRSKVKKYNVTILADPDKTLPNKWKLGKADDKSVVLIIGKDKKLAYCRKGHLTEQETKDVIDLLKKQIAAAGGPADGKAAAPAPG